MDCMIDSNNCSTQNGMFEYSTASIAVFLFLDGILELLSLAANSIFLFILVKQKSLHSPSNMLLGALCVADLGVGLILQPIFLTHLILHLAGADFHKALEEALDLLFDMFFGLTFTFVILISLDRYVAVCYPFRYHAWATCKSHLCISTACGVVMPGLFSLNYYVSRSTHESLIKDQVNSTLRLVHYSIPAVLILFCYGKIYLVIRAQRRRQAPVARNTDRDKVENARRRSERRNTGTIALILLCFFACYAPNFILVLLTVLTAFPVDEKAVEIAWLWTSFAFLATSLLDPIVYYLRSNEIRQAARKLCKRSQVYWNG